MRAEMAASAGDSALGDPDLRRRFFEDTERRTMHAGSITDADWVPLVEKLPGPWCFVSEAVLLYGPVMSRTQLGKAYRLNRFAVG
jgi:hypothetical protein